MVKPASLPRISGPITCLALLLSSLPTIAQEAKKLPDGKEQSEEAVFIPIEYRPPPYQVSVGVRLSGKAKVKFSGLGAIPFDTFPGADASTVSGRIYHDGAVYLDSTYDIDKNRIEPTDGKTNSWEFTSSDQVVEHATLGKSVAYHSYAVVSSGATREAESGSSTTWDLEITRQLGGNRKITWGILFGASLTSINAKTSATNQAYLRTITDYYSLAGITLPTDISIGASYEGVVEYNPYTWKLMDDGTTPVVDANGAKIPVYELDANRNKVKKWTTAQRLPDHPGQRIDAIDLNNPVEVQGYWQVKGAFMTARFGPYVALQLGRHFALRASAGVTFTVLGADFALNERYMYPASTAYLELDAKLTDATVSGTLGYYVEGELQAFLTQRTGIFIGASHEDYARDIRMQIYGQTADLSASSGTAIRTGITTRF